MEKRYLSTWVRLAFLFKETKITADLLLKGLSEKEAKAKIIEENLFQVSAESTLVKYARECLGRLENMRPDQILSMLAGAPVSVSKQANLYIIMCSNPVEREFMINVIGEKFRIGDLTFGKKDVNLFLEELAEQNESVAAWSETSVKNVRRALLSNLEQTGYLDNVSSKKLNPVYLEPELERIIRERGDDDALAAFNCLS